MIQLSDVRIFLEIVRTTSFTAAGEALRLPKSSVARQVARLEATVGCLLFKRTSRTVTLTDEGRTFLPHARRLLDDGIEAQNVLRSKGKGASGHLSVTATGLIGRAFLVPDLPAFLDNNPGVRVSLWLTPGRVALGSAPGEADIAIRLRSIAGPDIGTRKLGDIPFCVVAAPAYLAARGIPRTPGDLTGHAVVELGPPNKTHVAQFCRGNEIATVGYTPSLQIDDPEAVHIATLAGAGVGMLPAFLVAASLANGSLVRVLPDWAPPPVPINLLYRTDVAPPVRVRAYIDFLSETIGRRQPWCPAAG